MTDQLPVIKILQGDCEMKIVGKETKHTASDAKNRLESGETAASEGAFPHDAVAVTVNDMQVSVANVTFSMMGRATNYGDDVMAEEGEEETARASRYDVQPQEK
ncbi:hypothetical protein CGRA01v4_00342 [Colletotrichum graminicola]|uniref:Uncharacterized protein n=1 Tax=Colletotrichum graminicola (strain M1.001 / M2 / FGSC 10212) TaxID=645133 RepID=E3QH98_COLGM|nr:uncharacterized protein GLRG_05404 [Colletotrichum graminicola M1.001]EFQ30260.1 hypothetical protein GLRG_05404 [Colletotrichum graminicola M1.001]WDK09064.1 hypothetical protein CGRA01v4_00342 [Colletotrichum graminicola]